MTLAGLDVEGIDFASGNIPNAHRLLATLRARKPYAVVPFGGGRAIVLLTHELVTAAFKDEETFPAAAAHPPSGPVLGHTVQCMAGAAHRIHERLATPAFHDGLVGGYGSELFEPVAHELVDRFSRHEVDLVVEFTEQYPVLVVARMLGLPLADESVLWRWMHDLYYYPVEPDGAARASDEFGAYLREIIRRRRERPGDDLISTLLTVDGYSDESVLAFARMLFPAAADTVMLSLGNVLAALLTHPAQLAKVRRHPKTELSWAVQEALRWEPPVGMLPRLCMRRTEWHGITIPAATPVVFAITSANRDPAVYPDPDAYDLDRRAMATLAFGDGAHACLGARFALAELTAGLKVLVERLPDMRLAPGADARVGSRMTPVLRGPSSLPVLLGR